MRYTIVTLAVLTLIAIGHASSAELFGTSTPDRPTALSDHPSLAMALSDGTVDTSEYVAATSAITRCITDQGFMVNGPNWDDHRQWLGYTYLVPEDADPSPADACFGSDAQAIRDHYESALTAELRSDDDLWTDWSACLSRFASEAIVYDSEDSSQFTEQIRLRNVMFRMIEQDPGASECLEIYPMWHPAEG